MSLITSTRTDGLHMHLEVQGSWRYNDALILAYQLKAVALRERRDQVFLDLRRLTRSPGVEGKFLVMDRLRRALPPSMKVALLGPVEMVDLEPRNNPALATVVLFSSERSALKWLDGLPAARKNPPVLRAEGQAAGKET